jgi:molybdenum cofactor biosynthesis enzyme MoaA
MELEKIGFYTLSDYRAKNTSNTSPLYRCELLLTNKCNFNCPYCRKSNKGEITLDYAKSVIDLWAKDGLKNVRFSGGEPTLWKDLNELVIYTKSKGINRIALSTNGSANLDYYKQLIESGVNDLSISLDACCSSFNDKMTGIKGAWEKVVSNIKEISKLTYVTIGVVVNEDTLNELPKLINFIDLLGVSDIRIIPSAQYNKTLDIAKNLSEDMLNKYPILKYRIDNIKNNKHVRGMNENDSRKCYLTLDDMAIDREYHYPCIIYMREGGKPIGKVSPNMREERKQWCETHDCFKDKICRQNCLDVCVAYNDTCMNYDIEKNIKIPKLDSTVFTWDKWSGISQLNLI